MKIRILYTAAWLLVSSVCFISCEDWLDVVSQSEVREEDHFSTPEGFQQSLIGCYISMGDAYLYGKNLSWHMPELLGRQFAPYQLAGSNATDYYLQNYLYNSTGNTKAIMERIWLNGYHVIANANNVLTIIDEKEHVLGPVLHDIIKGELLAIRAYMHFDLLRLYGYGNWSNRAESLNNKLTLPYVTTVSKEITPQSTYQGFIQAVLNDLNEALNFLKADPVLKSHDDNYYAAANEEGFLDNRCDRLNYYAVMAIKARVLLWEGSSADRNAALQTALDAIEGSIDNGLADWIKNTQLPDDPAMTVEHIFSLNVANLSTNTSSYIKPSFLDSEVGILPMYLSKGEAEALYEITGVGVTDWRFSTMLVPVLGINYVPLKLYQPSIITFYNTRSNHFPMIRLAELYLIAAECYATGTTPDLEKALDLLNEMREKRGIYSPLSGLDATGVLEEIGKEYRKDFLSEGVMFFYYKRTGANLIPMFSNTLNPVEMNDEKYVLPYPDIEILSGRIQSID
jgi:hypothetical protein